MILVAGEALIDLIEGDPGSFTAVPGGAPANVAIGLARLGQDSHLLARISGDAFGTRIRNHLLEGGVQLDLVAEAAEATSLAVASLDEAGVARYAFYLDGTADWQWREEELPSPVPSGLRFAHFGSLGLAVGPGNALLEGFMGSCRDLGGVVVSIDLNIRPGIGAEHAAEIERVERQSALADIVKVSEEDLEWLYPELSREEGALRLIGDSGALAVLTLGGEGSLLLRAGRDTLWSPPRPTAVVDTVGAGDAYCAGLLDALARVIGDGGPEALHALDETALLDAMAWATTTASLTCERAGAQPPRRDEVLAAKA